MNNYPSSQLIEGSTTIKSQIRRQIKQHDDNNNNHEKDEKIIQIEQKITKLKVQAAEADDLKMTQSALYEKLFESQKEIKRVQRDKKAALNKSVEILEKLMVHIKVLSV